jgi:DNA topoisomerase-1
MSGRTAAKALHELGEHPDRGGPVNVMEGRYGPYVKWEKVNATIPKGTEPGDVTMEMAVQLIVEREAKAGKKKPAAKKKAPAKKKTTAKKAS